MIILTIAFVSCISWLRSEIERSADMKSCRKCCQFFVSGFVGLLTYPFMCRQFSCTNALFQPSRGAMTALPMTGFHRAQISLHGKQYFRNTATLGILPCTPAFQIRGLQTIRQSSFRVRDSHPIPLFSWNKHACPFGTAGAVCTASASVRVAHLPQKPVIDSLFIFVFACIVSFCLCITSHCYVLLL